LRTEIWYPLVMFGLLAWLVLGLQAALTIPLGSANEWLNWGFGVGAVLLSLTSGVYATRNTWIEDLFKGFIGLNPVVALIVGGGFIWGVWKLALAVAPDKFAAVTVGVGFIVLAWWLPMIMENAIPPGDFADAMSTGVGAVSDWTVGRTQGWFS
jgi:hypothetical protein